MPSPIRHLRAVAAALAEVVLAATLALAQPAPADFTDATGPPSGRRGERIREVLDAVNSGDTGRIETLVKTAFGGPFREMPLQDHLDALLGLHDRSRGIDFYGVRRAIPSGPTDRELVIVRDRLAGGWLGLSIRFGGTPEERIVGLEINSARPPKGLPQQSPLTLEQAKAELGAFLDRLSDAEVFSGTVLLARNGQVLFEAARGIADRNHAVPMRLESKLNLGSMNKMFTAVVIGELVDEGRMSFQDPVSQYLGGKGWTKADLSKVRIENLLSHTSGLGNYFNETYRRTARQLLRKVDDYKPLVAEETLVFEPGTRGEYSNTGMLLAGAVIEAVTGRDYFDVVRERIYTRAGMPNSDSYDLDLVVPDLAIGYSKEHTAAGPRWRNNTFDHVIRGGPAGGGYSTARDLLAFAEALRAGRLVNPATAELLWSPKPELHGNPGYGFGFGIGRDALGRRVGHTGGFSGISSCLDIYLDTGWTIVVLSNADDGMPPIAQKLREVAGRIR